MKCPQHAHNPKSPTSLPERYYKQTHLALLPLKHQSQTDISCTSAIPPFRHHKQTYCTPTIVPLRHHQQTHIALLQSYHSDITNRHILNSYNRATQTSPIDILHSYNPATQTSPTDTYCTPTILPFRHHQQTHIALPQSCLFIQERCWFFSYIIIENYGSGNLQDSKRNGS